MRMVKGLSALSKGLPWAVLILTPLAVCYRYRVVPAPVLTVACILAVAGLIGIFFWFFRRGAGIVEATLRLDETHELRGRLAAALEYAGVFGARDRRVVDDDGYVAIVLKDAEEIADLSPERAAPVTVPRSLAWGGLMLAAWSVIFLVPDREPPQQEPAGSTASAPLKQENWLLEDDAELLEAASQELDESVASDEGKAAAEQFNEIVLKAVSGEINQTEAFRLAAELQADLEAASQEATELKEGLDRRGASLEKRHVTRPVGRALTERNYEEAEKALQKLAERLASEQKSLSKEELDQLRESIEEMRGDVETQEAGEKSAASADERERAALEERQKRLLTKKQEGKLSDSEKREMEQNERRLRRLSRRKKTSESAQKTLSELDKQLADAARELQKEQKKAGEYLNQASETLSKGVQKQLSDEEKKELIKQLKALKERLRRQNKDGKQAERLREFQKRARGQQGQQSGEPGKGGNPQPGHGQGRMKIGPGGAPLPIPGAGSGQQPGKEQGGTQPGSGKEAGNSHDPNLSGEESQLDGAGLEDTMAVAQDTGQGQSASETILSVAEEGFTSSSYEKLYREYETVAEEVMDKDVVPVGRKAHILRYFELIRPRAAGAPQPQSPPEGNP